MSKSQLKRIAIQKSGRFLSAIAIVQAHADCVKDSEEVRYERSPLFGTWNDSQEAKDAKKDYDKLIDAIAFFTAEHDRLTLAERELSAARIEGMEWCIGMLHDANDQSEVGDAFDMAIASARSEIARLREEGK